MANIPGFEAPNLGLQPTEIGIESLAATARRAGAFYNQKAEALSRTGHEVGTAVQDLGNAMDLVVTHRQISQGGLEFSKLIAQSTADWNDTNSKADPNDPSVAGRFREEVLEPRLQKFLDSFDTQQGQNWALNHVNQLRQHFVEKTTADMATNAQIAVQTNVEQMRNAWSNTARTDPSSVPFLLSNAETSIDGQIASSPNLKGTAGVKIKAEILQKAQEQIVKAGALGAIEASADPEKAAAEWARRYPTLINAQEIDQFGKTARVYRRWNDQAEKEGEAYVRRQNTEAFDRDATQLELSTIDENGNPVLPQDYTKRMKELATKYGDVEGPRIAARMNSLLHRQQEVSRMTDDTQRANLNKRSDQTERQLYGQIHPTDGSDPVRDDTRVYQEYSKGNLTWEARNRLLGDINGLKSFDGESIEKDRTRMFGRFERVIDPSINQRGEKSELGAVRMTEMQQYGRQLEQEAIKNGKPPRDVYNNSASPYYLFSDANLARFRPSMQEIMQYRKDLNKAASDPTRGNLTGPGKDSSVVSVESKFAPPANWQFSASRNQYRDPAGNLYDLNGKPVK